MSTFSTLLLRDFFPLEILEIWSSQRLNQTIQISRLSVFKKGRLVKKNAEIKKIENMNFLLAFFKEQSQKMRPYDS
jgi:hypothetical protein